MFVQSQLVAVPNALLFVRDSWLKDRPSINGAAFFWTTRSCVAVSCRPDSDGETELTLGPAPQVGLTRSPSFHGWIDTPTRRVLVEIVPGVIVLQAEVSGLSTRVQIWTDGYRDTGTVIVGLD